MMLRGANTGIGSKQTNYIHITKSLLFENISKFDKILDDEERLKSNFWVDLSPMCITVI